MRKIILAKLLEHFIENILVIEIYLKSKNPEDLLIDLTQYDFGVEKIENNGYESLNYNFSVGGEFISVVLLIVAFGIAYLTGPGELVLAFAALFFFLKDVIE